MGHGLAGPCWRPRQRILAPGIGFRRRRPQRRVVQLGAPCRHKRHHPFAELVRLPGTGVRRPGGIHRTQSDQLRYGLFRLCQDTNPAQDNPLQHELPGHYLDRPVGPEVPPGRRRPGPDIHGKARDHLWDTGGLLPGHQQHLSPAQQQLHGPLRLERPSDQPHAERRHRCDGAYSRGNKRRSEGRVPRSGGLSRPLPYRNRLFRNLRRVSQRGVQGRLRLDGPHGGRQYGPVRQGAVRTNRRRWPNATGGRVLRVARLLVLLPCHHRGPGQQHGHGGQSLLQDHLRWTPLHHQAGRRGYRRQRRAQGRRGKLREDLRRLPQPLGRL